MSGLSPSDLANPHWRLANLYWITDKDGNKILFRPNAAQRWFSARPAREAA